MREGRPLDVVMWWGRINMRGGAWGEREPGQGLARMDGDSAGTAQGIGREGITGRWAGQRPPRGVPAPPAREPRGGLLGRAPVRFARGRGSRPKLGPSIVLVRRASRATPRAGSTGPRRAALSWASGAPFRRGPPLSVWCRLSGPGRRDPAPLLRRRAKQEAQGEDRRGEEHRRERVAVFSWLSTERR